jgi:hypothetical protein
MDWLDAYLDGMENYKTTISPADTHIWGVKPKMNNIQERMQFDAAAQSEVEYRQLIQEARQDLEAHGMSQHDIACGIGADPGSPARASSPSVTPTITPTPTISITPTRTPTVTPTISITPTIPSGLPYSSTNSITLVDPDYPDQNGNYPKTNVGTYTDDIGVTTTNIYGNTSFDSLVAYNRYILFNVTTNRWELGAYESYGEGGLAWYGILGGANFASNPSSNQNYIPTDGWSRNIVITATPDPSPTPTITKTPTVTPSITVTLTRTPTPTVTPTMTRTPAPSNTPSTTPTVTPTVTPTASPVVALPNNPVGPISFVSTKSAGNTWFGIRTSTGFAKTTWWDGSSQVDGYPVAYSYIYPQKTAVGGTRTISVSSCNASGVLSGSITGWYYQSANTISVNAAGCSNISEFTNNNSSAVSAINIIGCKNIASLALNDDTNLSSDSLLMNGCTGFYSVNIASNPKISYLDLSGHSNLTSCILQSNGLTGINLQDSGLSGYGITLNMGANKFTALDLNRFNAKINYVSVAGTPTLSSLVLPYNAYSLANMSDFDCSVCSLTSLDMTRLSGGALYQFDISNNKLTSIDIPAGWGGRVGYQTNVNIRNNNLNATALNNFFTTLGTYIGTYDMYGAGGSIYISGNPGSSTCNTSIATAKGWQPFN